MKRSQGMSSPLGLALLSTFVICSICTRAAKFEHSGSGEKAKVFIVYLGKNPHPTKEATHASHHNVLSYVFKSKDSVLESLVYHYHHGFSGFSAKLTQRQADVLKDLPDVVSVFESKEVKAHTTRSYSYLGLRKPTTGIWPKSSFGADVIIGVIDSGVWPESDSFNDDLLSPIPARWNGICVSGEQFDPKIHCNRKLIGARYFSKGYEAYLETNNITATNFLKSPRDVIGHGTHCASTAAGAKVENASLFGLAPGSAVGGAPAARIAVYKAFWGDPSSGSAWEADLLAAFSYAIEDGVDILSISSSGGVNDFYETANDIGSYHAAESGIFVSFAAGNAGPTPFTTSNNAPWALTVAASTTDRQFKTEIELGDGTIIQGATLNNYESKVGRFPIVDGASIPAANVTSTESRFCRVDSLNPKMVQGKIVLCDLDIPLNVQPMEAYLKAAGGAGVIIVGPSTIFAGDSGFPFTWLSDIFNYTLPAVGISERTAVDSYLSACSYIQGSDSTAMIKRRRTILTGEWNPVTAHFSSRGPNGAAFNILKPDLTAPGVDILASWSEADSASIIGPDGVTKQITKFNLQSGTSMAAPHIAGLAAIVKSRHRDWSPAAIKSALMTSAKPISKGTALDHGAGEVRIKRALDPGLIYDMTPADYKVFLCGRNYTNEQFEQITSEPISICNNLTSTLDVNYPSISFSTIVRESSVVRTVTNVGPAVSVYEVSIIQPGPDMVLSVSPSTLSFTEVDQKLSFTVSVRITSPREVIQDAVTFEKYEIDELIEGPTTLQHYEGSIRWTDRGARHQVFSPVSLWNYPV
ncbi:hypothetical protein Mapa_012790 [Marchantia paleacea]|nr:hypothetical protein Mapa_012790 [Marchantia paleacea]